MNRERHISSLITLARVERLDAVVAAINEVPGAEIFADDGAGKIVVVIETGDAAGLLAGIEQISRIDGVLTTNLVYHQTEDAELLQEEVNYENYAS